MSDFLKKFKSVFIVDDGSATKAPAAPSNTAEAPASAPEAPAAPPPAAGDITDKFIEILAGALEKNNQPGFDYFEFRQSLANLGKMSMDETTRFKSAYAMAQTMGVSKTQLIESAKFYIQILGGEQAKFNEAHTQQRAKLIGNREEEVNNLEKAIQQKAAQIEALKNEMEEHRQRAEQMRAEIGDSTLKIEKTKSDFDTTFQSVVDQLQEDVDKINQYL